MDRCPRIKGQVDKIVESRITALKPVLPFSCAFCGKYQHEVWQLIQGPTCCICDECTELIVDMIRKTNHTFCTEFVK